MRGVATLRRSAGSNRPSWLSSAQDRCQACQVFGFQRKYIPALSRNDPPGSMARKAGLAREQEYFEKAWREDGRLALMHDLRPA
jgi:hypothetical protein